MSVVLWWIRWWARRRERETSVAGSWSWALRPLVLPAVMNIRHCHFKVVLIVDVAIGIGGIWTDVLSVVASGGLCSWEWHPDKLSWRVWQVRNFGIHGTRCHGAIANFS